MISSINSFLGDVDSNQKEISNLIKENKARLECIKKEKTKLDRRLDFLLDDANEEEIKEFKSEYKKEDKRIKEELFRCKESIETLEETYNQNKVNNFTLKPIQDVAKKAIQSIEENDPTALKAVYRLLFEQIVVSDLNNEGVRELNFVLRDFRSTEDGNLVRFTEKMVPQNQQRLNQLPALGLVIKSELYKPNILLDKTYLHQKYVVEGLNLSQLSKELNTPRTTLRSYLIKHGIEIRSQINQEKLQSHNKYGKHKRKGETIDKKVEQKTIDAIFEMRKSGMSLRSIAKTLDQLKIPTKTKGKKWQYETIRQILIKNNFKKE